ncbi:MAG: lipopolysaccharide biosynthesis protein [Chitinophagaceae bacterium]|nr:MAG: lipopolysaccharide biosynthesis protein [Chitinophagaceae bacterium]
MAESQKVQYNSSDEVTFGEIFFKVKRVFNYLLGKWKIIALTGVLGGALGFMYALFQKPTYTASLTFALEDDKSSGGGLGGALGLASSLGFDLGTNGGGAFSGTNLMALMKSRKLIEQTLLTPVSVNNKMVTLAEQYLVFEGWRETWEKKNPVFNQKLQYSITADRSTFSLQQDSVLGLIYEKLVKDNIRIDQKDKKVSIISVDVKTKDELFSKYFTEILAKEISDFYVETKSRKAKMNVTILEKQADSVRRELYGAINGVAVANDITYNLNPALNVNRTPSARRQVDVQANTAILTQLVINLELARVTLRKETPLIQIIDKPILPLYKERASKMIYAITTALLLSFILINILIFRRWLQKNAQPKQ